MVRPDEQPALRPLGFRLRQGIDRLRRELPEQPFPAPPIVVRLEDIRFEVVQPVAVHRDVQAIPVVGTPQNLRDPERPVRRSLGQGRGTFHPRVPPVPADMDPPIVRSHRTLPEAQRTLVERRNRPERNIPGAPAPREIWGNGFPGLALVQGTMDFVGAQVQNVRLVGRQSHRGLPVPAQRRLAQRMHGPQR